MSSNRVRLISDTDIDALQDAGDRVSELTLQGIHPTEAVAKVASAMKLPVHKTELLIYAYNNGVSAEKRASAGGPFERLQSFPIADPVKVKELVYGLPSDSLQTKSASLEDDFDLPLGMATFDTDISGLDYDDVKTALGFATKTATKTASGGGSDNKDSGDKKPDDKDSGFSISHTTFRIGICPMGQKEKDTRFVHEIPKSIKEQIEAGFKMMSPELNSDLDTSLLRMMGLKEGAMHTANGEADEAYAAMCGLLQEMQRNIGARHLSPSFKAAGLTSVNAYYPDVASILSSDVGEVDAYLIKNAEYSLLAVNRNHPWVADAKRAQEAMEKVADLTVTANICTEEYKAVRDLYKNRSRFKAADWRQFFVEENDEEKNAGIADVVSGTHIVNQAKDWYFGLIHSGADKVVKKNNQLKQDVLDDLDDPLHDSKLRDIEVQNMIGDFSANDEILSAFSVPDLLKSYNDLLRMSPVTMRSRAQARALLQQYMTQGRMAPTELLPALQMNRLAMHTSDKDGTDDAALGVKI